MKIRWLCLAPVVALPLLAKAQTNDTLSLEEMFTLGQQFIEENVDEEVLAQVRQVDSTQVDELLQQLQSSFDQDYVLDLAQLKQVATAGLTLLESNEDTQAYAEWLRPRLDYFDAAGQLDQLITIPEPTTNNPAPRKPAPVAYQEASVWTKTVKARPRPAAADKYEAVLKPIFARHDVPQELFWLAEVESSFNPKARSPAGAVGMYQLMPATAQSLGLSTWPFDERKNPEKAADAAARHLRSLHRQFNDWPLAVAAYNAGAGRVKSKMVAGKPNSFTDIAHKLPSETQMYVPKLNALLQLREGTTLQALNAKASGAGR